MQKQGEARFTLPVACNELKYVADVETDLGDLPPVVCNISDLNQAFLNLLVNAAHAIGDVVKGSVYPSNPWNVPERRKCHEARTFCRRRTQGIGGAAAHAAYPKP
jgi:hypothetical protein